MEDVLDLYARPEDPRRPVVCVDETSKQHLQEMRPPLPVMPGKPYRYDPEYKRNGVSNLFMIFAPLLGFRHVEVTDQRRSIDFQLMCSRHWGNDGTEFFLVEVFSSQLH